ncbi:hypothetical protein COCSUDRAFT_54877 [Coccomyxa subellipsoidea C-169]|uniref:Uncharacterized protein n=1 Tax=Coccomyxa subellipsoidea (strain C-169) TaxID=574566 RepID=I0YK40_COCSC|nr:hypothetical protein COCSUDRAFT_54877 [Coccomyxa subellipsoidea C-169]EIE18759.1 hypothetical protein COCSUDRAFT_54877 [Coccomyxa subellipsoidea C-169]|eukprot:XP_005643303.1 hypothetical protein COCSUDRAFT_54877 [Coccomyxa subellipsoidea C-169]
MASIRATYYLLGIIIVLLISAATAQDTDIYGNPVSSDQGSYVGGCSSQGDRLFNGNCGSFVEYFRARADYAISQSDADFRTTVNSSPYPSDGCCYDARSFVQGGCSCDRNLLSQAAQRGVSNNGIRIIARATQFSRCTSSQFGGGIGTGGC